MKTPPEGLELTLTEDEEDGDVGKHAVVGAAFFEAGGAAEEAVAAGLGGELAADGEWLEGLASEEWHTALSEIRPLPLASPTE